MQEPSDIGCVTCISLLSGIQFNYSQHINYFKGCRGLSMIGELKKFNTLFQHRTFHRVLSACLIRNRTSIKGQNISTDLQKWAQERGIPSQKCHCYVSKKTSFVLINMKYILCRKRKNQLLCVSKRCLLNMLPLLSIPSLELVLQSFPLFLFN